LVLSAKKKQASKADAQVCAKQSVFLHLAQNFEKLSVIIFAHHR
jgi:hypothetical protein